MKKTLIGIGLLAVLGANTVYAGLTDLVAQSKETSSEANFTKPRILIENTGLQTVSNFQVYYYFTAAEGKTPVLEDWYTPYSTPSIEFVKDDIYRVRLDFFGYSLEPGQIFPTADGLAIGLHYNDWSVWNKNDDPSYNPSTSFVDNSNMVVTLSTGEVIYGNLPQNTGNEASNQNPGTSETNIGSGLKVFAMDEGLSESNVSKPRIRIQNVGESAVSNFVVEYYFKTEAGKTPILEDWYTPNSVPSLVNVEGDLYKIVYNFAGFTLEAGASTPWPEASNVVGIHYGDWSTFDVSNDYSYTNSSNLMETHKILIKNTAGNLMYGLLPPDLLPTRNPISGDVARLLSFNNPQPTDFVGPSGFNVNVEYVTYMGEQAMHLTSVGYGEACFQFNGLDIGYPTPLGPVIRMRAALIKGHTAFHLIDPTDIDIAYPENTVETTPHTDYQWYEFNLYGFEARLNLGLEGTAKICISGGDVGANGDIYVDEIQLDGSY